MENLPIDIHYNKLLDWLVDRRHCNLKWQQAAASISQKVATAMKDAPQDPTLQELLRGSCVSYFSCLKIVEILKASGQGSKNIFGQYSSQKMKDWADILQSYQTDNIHLAEAAHLLIRNVNYEIPSLKRQIAKCQQTQRDCTRKESEYMANAGIFKEKYYNECKQMGVQGENIKNELLKLVDELPVLFKSIAEETKFLEDSILYYSQFVNFILARGAATAGNTEDLEKPGVTPMLSFVCKHGNATVYQWKTGKAPKDIHKEQLDLDLDDKLEDVTEIDWGAIGSEEVTNDVIDFGDAVDTIDFGSEEIELVDTTGISVEDNGAEIEFDIESRDEKDSAITNGAVSQEKGDDEEVATGSDALSILENTESRNLFIDELLEIQSFLQQRLEELITEGDILSAKQFQSAPTTIQIQSRDKVGNMLQKVSSILDDLTSTKMQNLYRLKSSPHYVHRLADSLQQKLKTANNLLRQASAVLDRKESANRLQIETEPKLEGIIRETKELKQQIATEISKKYKNRPVNIMGEINTI